MKLRPRYETRRFDAFTASFQGADLCQCLTVQPQQQRCDESMGFTLKGSCCLNKTSHIVGFVDLLAIALIHFHFFSVLLYNCSVEQLERSSRLNTSTFDASAADLIFMYVFTALPLLVSIGAVHFSDLSMNKLGDVNAEFFRGMTSLTSVTVPEVVFEECPGGKEAWKDQHVVGLDSLQCDEQVDVCEETKCSFYTRNLCEN
jgi:hypothetical protein